MFYSVGINKYNINKNNDTIHAEVDCIQNLKISKQKILKKIDLFVFRTNPKGNKLMMAKPCSNCLEYIHKNIQKKGYKLNRIYFTNEHGKLEYI